MITQILNLVVELIKKIINSILNYSISDLVSILTLILGVTAFYTWKKDHYISESDNYINYYEKLKTNYDSLYNLSINAEICEINKEKTNKEKMNKIYEIIKTTSLMLESDAIFKNKRYKTININIIKSMVKKIEEIQENYIAIDIQNDIAYYKNNLINKAIELDKDINIIYDFELKENYYIFYNRRLFNKYKRCFCNDKNNELFLIYTNLFNTKLFIEGNKKIDMKIKKYFSENFIDKFKNCIEIILFKKRTFKKIYKIEYQEQEYKLEELLGNIIIDKDNSEIVINENTSTPKIVSEYSVKETIEDSAKETIEDSAKETIEDSVKETIKECKNEIGFSIGKNRYFKSKNKTDIIFTSANWANCGDGTISTWYTVPEVGKKSIEEKNSYYFVVRPKDDNVDVEFVCITGKLMKKIKDKFSASGDYYHLYLSWDKSKEFLKDERSGLDLSNYINNGLKIEVGKLVDGKFII